MGSLGFFANAAGKFQAALLFMLFAGIVSSFWGIMQFLAIFFFAELLCAYLAVRLPEEDRPGAFALLAFFSFITLATALFRPFLQSPSSLAYFAPAAAICFAVFYAAYKTMFLKNSVNAEVLACANGYAVVRVKPGFSHGLKAGEYAIATKEPFKAGETAKAVLRKKIFSASEISGLEKPQNNPKIKSKGK